MIPFRSSAFLRATLLLLLPAMSLAISAHASDTFQKPTKEELAMTELPGYPGAPAVVLYREEISKDEMHVSGFYERVKILTEKGKDLANVEIRSASYNDEDAFEIGGTDNKIVDIVGRTIHADGTIIPFTGKPYRKALVKGQNFTREATIFTMPDVEVGSIIEYRYNLRYSDQYFQPPAWYIQGDLFLKSAHYVWYPTTKDTISRKNGAPISAISWFPILPPGAKIVTTSTPSLVPGAQDKPQNTFTLDVKDVPPSPEEEYMPPLGSFTYRVLFNMTEYRSGEDFWKSEGKDWSHEVNSFADQSGELRSATDAIVAGASTQSEKLHKIYAAVEDLDNTRFTREHERAEDKAAGLGKVSKAVDVLNHKRGTPLQITRLFIAMARSEGFAAYAMEVPDRSRELFTAQWLNTSQFDDEIAIVTVDGKEQFFDPGERDCPFGHLAWQHTYVDGLRQTAEGTGFAKSPGDPYSLNRTSRVANLKMDEHGEVSGNIDVTYMGAAALTWRQRALGGDEESVKKALRTHLEKELPQSVEVKVGEIKNLSDYENPLLVHYEVKGAIGSPTGKRLVIPADLFTTNDTATFPQEKREMAVYFHYPQVVQDALRINLPSNLTVEAIPDPAKITFPNHAQYDMTVTSAPTNVTTRRNLIDGDVAVAVTSYKDLRTFYSQFEPKDKETIVLKAGAPTATATSSGGMN